MTDLIQLSNKLNSLIETSEANRKAIETAFINNNLYLAFLMHIAYMLYEIAGSRHKNWVYTVIKSLIETCVISICWYTVGYAFAFGESENKGIGKSLFAESKYSNHSDYNKFMLSWAYVVISFRIANSCILERVDLHTSAIYASFYSLIIFPISAHWGWNKGGWLRDLGFTDSGGAGIVVLMGVSSAFAVQVLNGKRSNRDAHEKQGDFRISNLPYIGFAGFIIWFCRYGFNSASLAFSEVLDGVANSNYSILIGRISMVTTVSPAICGLILFFIHWIYNKGGQEEYSILRISNGIIMGVLAVSGSPENYFAWGGIVIGCISVPIYLFYSWVLKKWFDDPLDALATNFTAGTWGLVAVGWLHKDKGLVFDNGGKLFGYQLLGMVIYMAWPFVCTMILFLILKIGQWHKLKESLETTGVDTAKCGGVSFNYDEASAKEVAKQLTEYVHLPDRRLETAENLKRGEDKGIELIEHNKSNDEYGKNSKRAIMNDLDNEKEKIAREEIERERKRQQEIEMERNRQKNIEQKKLKKEEEDKDDDFNIKNDV